MANKAISELPQAQNVNNQDLFVLEQSGIAKKLPAETFITEQGIIDALAEALDGHGGIQSVTLSSVSGRIRTYRITFSDGSATTFQVYDGTSIDRISRTSSSGLDDVYTIFLSDGTTTFFTVHNGADGTVSEAMLNDALKDKAPAVTETTESSAIANFTDGADNMPLHNILAEINPVQDLTYGDPYPAGSGKNKLEPIGAKSVTNNGITFTSNGDGTYSVSGTSTSGSATCSLYYSKQVPIKAGTYYLNVLNNAVPSVTVGFYMFANNVRVWDVVLNTTNRQAQVIVPSDIDGTALQIYVATAGTVNFTLSPVLSTDSYASTFTPYSNICPITGHTEVNVTRTGKNLFPIQIEPLRVWATNRQDMVAFMNTLKAGTYTLSCVNKIQSVRSGDTAAEFMLGVWPRNSAIGNQFSLECRTAITSSQEVAGFSATSTKTITITEAMVGNFNHFYLYSGDNRGNATSSFDIQLELGSTATAYEPYQGTTLTVDWATEAGTVYGGTIDVATGLLTVYLKYRQYNGEESEGWKYSSWSKVETYVFYSEDYLRDGANRVENYNCIKYCNQFRPTWYTSLRENDTPQIAITGGSAPCPSIRIPKSVISSGTVAALNAYLASNPLEIVYELATPQTYQLTPQEVKTLLGTNNVWADIGNVSVTYAADTKMFIEKLTMPTEDDMVANQAITSGKYFMIGNSLYLALANIASGAQITIGTNAQRVSLADALNTINS